eukprot:1952699-Rhodomonas_salina.1
MQVRPYQGVPIENTEPGIAIAVFLHSVHWNYYGRSSCRPRVIVKISNYPPVQRYFDGNKSMESYNTREYLDLQ